LFAQREKPPWGAEPGIELGPAIQQASALPTEPRCTLVIMFVFKKEKKKEKAAYRRW